MGRRDVSMEEGENYGGEWGGVKFFGGEKRRGGG